MLVQQHLEQYRKQGYVEFNMFCCQWWFVSVGWGLSLFQTTESLVKPVGAETMSIPFSFRFRGCWSRGWLPRAFYYRGIEESDCPVSTCATHEPVDG